MTAMLHAYTYPLKIKKERASGPALTSGVTVEAALTIPVFLFAALSLIFLLEIRSIQMKVAFAAENAAKEAASDLSVSYALNPFKIKKDIIEAVGRERADRSIIRGGAEGLRCTKSYLSYLTDEVHVIVEYSVSLPFPCFCGTSADFLGEAKARRWSGLSAKTDSGEDEKIVYITKDSDVYHVRRDCTHLKLSIKFIPFEDLKSSRNIKGEKYKRCKKCVYGEPYGGVYITDSGDKYHSSLNCGGLKRTVYAVKKSEAGRRSGCKRCSQ